MNGLMYIRIRCNLSQAFLAQKIGVSRQAVHLWEQQGASLSEKRQAQLEAFFGISRKYFGALSPKEIEEIDKMPLFLQQEEKHEYYCFSVKNEGIPRPIYETYFPSSGDNVSGNSLSERLTRAKGEYQQILSEAQGLTADGNFSSQLLLTERLSLLYGILTDILQSIPNTRHFGRHFTMYQVLQDIIMATGIAYGCLDSADIQPEIAIAPDGNVVNNYLDHEWMINLATTMRDHLLNQVCQREKDLQLKDQWDHHFPPIVSRE